MKRLLLLILNLLFALSAFAQSFTANVDNVGNYYRLTFTVTDKDVSNFTPPSLTRFDVLSGPNVSTFSNYQMINGRTSHSESTSYSYIISPKSSGKQTIGAASIKVGNRILHSRPVTFNAQAGSAPLSRHSANTQSGRQAPIDNTIQQAGSPVTERDLFIDVTTDKTQVNEQEALLLTYRIHARVGVGLANTQLIDKPDFKGLISQEIPLPGNQIQTSLEQRNGTTYRTGTILQYVLFPQQSGRLTIPSITFDCSVVQQDHHMDLAEAFFNGGGSIGVTVRRTVPAKVIQVNALPQPRPSNFSGAVGKFDISGKVLNAVIKTNEIATYRITLNGTGNLKLITPPDVKFPSDFESYEAKTNENTKVSANGLTGNVTFDYTFIPRNTGEYDIPPIDFGYFDLESKSYKTITTQPIHLNVTQGARSNDDVDRQLALLRSDIKDIHAAGNQSSIPAVYKWGSTGFHLINALLITLFIIALIGLRKYSKLHTDSKAMRRKKACKNALDTLSEAERVMNQSPESFYTLTSQALTSFISDAFGMAQADLNTRHIHDMLASKGTNEADISLLLDVLQTCEYAKYAPATDSRYQDVLQKARQAIEAIQKSI